MLTALLSDVHSNLAALTACLAHARDRGVDRFVFLGDLVGYGPEPGAVVDTIAALDGAVVLKGNHDEAVELEPKTSELNDLAYQAIVWTRAALRPSQRQFLADLPLMVKEDNICYVHASADKPGRWVYIDDGAFAQRSLEVASVPYVFSGHVHDQALYFETTTGRMSAFRPTPGKPVPIPHRRHWLSIVGSVGQPRDGNPAAAYAIFNGATEMMTFHRIPYDHLATARRIVEVGLPEILAERIVEGR
jgi:diadenosine tetraphosphatase ApaH/serine/threonine PP2A family protein phosphatase